jgi:hypothetical protein
MRIIKTVFLMFVLTTALSLPTGCANKSSGANNNSSDSVKVAVNNHIEALMCLYSNSYLFNTTYGGAQGSYMIHKGDTLRARAYHKFIYNNTDGTGYYDTFNIVSTFNYVCGCVVTLHCNNYDTIAKSDMTWNIGY